NSRSATVERVKRWRHLFRKVDERKGFEASSCWQLLVAVLHHHGPNKELKEEKNQKGKHKEEYAGDEWIRVMQVLNLMREFELQKMKESETIKGYSDRLLGIANKIKLLGTNFAYFIIVEKILIQSINNIFVKHKGFVQNHFDRSHTCIVGLRATKTYEARSKSYKKTQPTNNENTANNYNKGKDKKKNYPPCQHYSRMGHPYLNDEKDQMQNVASAIKWAKNEQEEEEDQIFVATYFSNNIICESWLIDSGYNNHITYDKELFKQLESTKIKWVKIGNGEQIPIKGKGTIAITSYSGTKILIDILYVPRIDQNLFSVGQLLKKGFKVIFENKRCIIKDLTSQEMFKVKMKSKSFSFDPMKEE
ncbi:hypothetical protein CR513_61959, partial [Mucuna pruriens]